MTWIVGMPTVFGYSVGISDIRVTLADGSEQDCLQKIHHIASSIALGFAGSVRIGFEMVEAMRHWLKHDGPDEAWHPLEAAQLWPTIAQEIYARAPVRERDLQCHLIMLSADPQVTGGLGPATYVHIFRSPDFAPVQVATNKVAGIGSGNFIEEFSEKLILLSEDRDRNFTMMKMEAGNSGGMGGFLGLEVTDLIKRTSPTGISSHLHYCWVYLGKTVIKTNDHTTMGAWTAMSFGSGINRPKEPPEPSRSKPERDPNATYFLMPRIAKTWGELEKMLAGTGATAEGCVT